MSIRLDTSKLRGCVLKVAAETHRNKDKLMKQAARGFVRTMIEITPPGSRDHTGNAAKALGEFAIQDDILKLVYATTVVGRSKKGLATPADLLAAHAAARAGHNGRVSQRDVRQRLYMASADINQVIASLQKQVGYLASGWNRAALYLGVHVPQWIRRHGSAHGVLEPTVTRTRFRLKVGNAVPFVGNVRHFQQRLIIAVSLQMGALRRQSAAILAKAKQSAGF